MSVLPTERLTAKKDWNGQKIICIARRSGNSRADEELLKTETLPLNVECEYYCVRVRVCVYVRVRVCVCICAFVRVSGSLAGQIK